MRRRLLAGVAVLAAVVLVIAAIQHRRGPDAKPLPGPSLKVAAGERYVGTAVDAVALDREPGYQKVRNTRLSRLVNTPARVFRDDAQGTFYVQIGDDWYSAKTTDGPWKHVPSTQLPADFASVGR